MSILLTEEGGLNFLEQNIFALATVCILGAMVMTFLYIVRKWKSKQDSQEYAFLYPLVNDRVSGEAQFMFELPEDDEALLQILDKEDKVVKILVKNRLIKGSYPTYFDTTTLSNGSYYYQLKTSNQVNTKKFSIEN